MSLNFDSQGRLSTDPAYDGSQLGSMELYNLQLQKVVADFTDFDAVTKKYVDSKIYDITDGLSPDGILNTISEINDYLTNNTAADGLVQQLNALTNSITTEQTTARAAESALSTGAGLGVNGQYVADSNTNFLQQAQSLKDADFKLDAKLNEVDTGLSNEVTARESAISGVQTSLNAVDAREVLNRQTADSDRASIRTEFAAADLSEKTRAEAAEAAIELRIDNLNSTQIDEGDKLFYTDDRVKNAGVHSYSPYDNEARQYGLPILTTVDNAFTQLNAELQAIHNKEDQVSGNITGLGDDIQTEISNRQNADNVITDSLNETSTKASNNEGRLDGHDGNIADLQDRPFDGAGGGFNVQHNTMDEYINGNGKFLYFSQRWRMYGKSDGSRLVFEYNSGTQETPVWKPAVPFISSV